MTSVTRPSVLFEDLLKRTAKKDGVTYGDIINLVGHHALGIGLIFFALPSALPLGFIPGVSFIFTVPILFFSLQLIFGQKLWLPKMISKRVVPHQALQRMLKMSIKIFKKLEYLIKPRLMWMTSFVVNILNGVIIFILGLFLCLPIPFSNLALSSLIILFGLGLLEKDGFIIILAYIGSAIYLSFMYLIIFAALKSIFF